MVSHATCLQARAALRALAVMLALGLASPVGAEVNALLERATITEGESVRLVLETDRRSHGNIDLAPLAGDFDVLSSQRSTQVQIANGQQTVSTRWIIELLPRRAGRLNVPSLRVDGEATPALTLQVTAASAGDPGADSALFMEAEVEPGLHYVQGQLLYRVRLYMAVSVLSGSIEAPEVPNATIERLGEDVNFSAMRNGRRFEVVERRFAVFPQQSGPLNIGSARFSGQVGDSGAGTSTMDRLLNRGRRASVLAPPLTMEVLPERPGFAAAEWLPAHDLQLVESWPDGEPSARVGEPLTRVLRLVARGLPSSRLQLPQIEASEGLRLYPDQPQRGDGSDGEWVVGSVEQRVALIPTRAGVLQLPELRVRWWDTGSDRERVAVLPARSIEVLPATPTATAISDEPTLVATPQPPRRAAEPSRGTVVWPALAGVLALLWLVTLAAWWRARRAAPAVYAPAPARTPRTADAALRAAHAACARDDAAAARAALVELARVSWPGADAANPADLAARSGAVELGAEIRRLDQVLFGARPAPWTGERLRALLPDRMAPPTATETEPADPLPPLNPPARKSRESFRA